LAVANHKGGTGKTTTAVHLAGGLAAHHLRVLLVDADSQGHATIWLTGYVPVEHDLADLVAGRSPGRVLVATGVDGLMLCPATLGTARLESELTTGRWGRWEDAIAQALEPLRGTFDWIVVDLPPSLSVVTVATLAAADLILVPTIPTRLGLAGLGGFLEWVEQYRASGVITAPLWRVLLTMADLDTHGEMRTRVGQAMVATLARRADLPVCATVVPRRVAVEEQVAGRLVLGQPGVDGPVADAYTAVVAELLATTRRAGARR
jgi:chromosome partitioning protein